MGTGSPWCGARTTQPSMIHPRLAVNNGWINVGWGSSSSVQVGGAEQPLSEPTDHLISHTFSPLHNNADKIYRSQSPDSYAQNVKSHANLSSIPTSKGVELHKWAIDSIMKVDTVIQLWLCHQEVLIVLQDTSSPYPTGPGTEMWGQKNVRVKNHISGSECKLGDSFADNCRPHEINPWSLYCSIQISSTESA